MLTLSKGMNTGRVFESNNLDLENLNFEMHDNE
jgi:hypothetical protein